MIPILIPVYKPELTFVNFVKELNSTLMEKKINSPIVIVNDGNPKDLDCFKQIENKHIFIVHHIVNLGKGRGLKTGINYILDNFNEVLGCVTCDADGQHCVVDIIRVIEYLNNSPNSLILGCRSFSSEVPFRSKLGNKLTCRVLNFFAGVKVSDTQTGLRGIPYDFMKVCLRLEGERYEFETNMLIESKNTGIEIKEVPIKTVYLNENKSSHFNPIIDSFRIYKLILKFSISSSLSSILDFILFSLIYFFSNKFFLAMLVARVCSVSFSFVFNKNFVFKFQNKNKIALFFRYTILAVFLFLSSYFGTMFLEKFIKIPLYFLKIIIESVLFIFSYWVQKNIIFKDKTIKNNI